MHASKFEVRVAVLVLTSLAGLAVGVMGDVLADDDVPVSVGHLIGAVLLSPITVTVAGDAVTFRNNGVLLWGGLFFWPVYSLLGWLWVWRRRRLAAIFIAPWCAQGFFQILRRYWAVMSV